MENNEPLIQIPVSSYERLIEINSKYSVLVNSLLTKHNMNLRYDKKELTLKGLTEEIFMKMLKSFETKRYNQTLEELIKEDKKEN